MKTAVLTFTSVFMIVSISMLVSGEPGNSAFARGANSDRATTENASEAKHDFVAVGHPTFVSPHASPVAIRDGHVFVANTPADTVDVIDADTKKIIARINVGIDPVSIAIRPDGKEVWVSNHVSDSVSVIDNDPKSPTYLHVIATVQEFDSKTKATSFDEPVGIAFASNDKVYVALSSENQIAVINVATRIIDKRLTIAAQDPRAIVVRGDRLYVIPFESNNKTQLSGGSAEKIDGDLVTFDAWNHSITNNSANIHGSDPPNSRIDQPTNPARHLIDGGIAGTMSLVGDPTVNDEGKAGRLSAAERDDMATFLLSVPYPPAQRRPYTTVVSRRAKDGFKLFHVDGERRADARSAERSGALVQRRSRWA
jgi:YVTN family beta-propeller protein